MLLGVVRFVRTRLGLEQDEQLRQKLIAAGLRAPSAVDTYFAIRLIGPVLAVLAGTFMPQNTFFWIVAFMAVAYLAPDMWVTIARACAGSTSGLGLPDALDLIVVCVDAGLGSRSGAAACRTGTGAEPAGDFARSSRKSISNSVPASNVSKPGRAWRRARRSIRS